ncbi:hypothetical protein WOLCODRAFT_166024 [Wolfiporia cocos MD-104 SS10]|uniref:Carbohydrate-binding module family 13 protein n=1 Tax=Wolfiporia cocos (strain MD-104) TaxID=742152 RepID=A0A2H3IYM0_WOLCO|nr:hypothetical protein WOLCODRAFT_166024 [Wolfiporia cocos MD-104 SS10]
MLWDIERIQMDDCGETIRIVWPATRLVFVHSNWGNVTSGELQISTLISEGHPAQSWKIFSAPPTAETTPVTQADAEAVHRSHVSEDGDFITTTRTVTTITRRLRYSQHTGDDNSTVAGEHPAFLCSMLADGQHELSPGNTHVSI